MKRQPKGAPDSAGGEFAGNSHDEAEAPLDASVVREKLLNSSLDKMWEEENRNRLAGVATPDYDSRRSDLWESLRSECKPDERGFVRGTFETPLPTQVRERDLLGGQYGQPPARLVGSRYEWARMASDSDVRAELYADIADGIDAGSLSDLFQYFVVVRRDEGNERTIRVGVVLPHGSTTNVQYRDLQRLHTSDAQGFSDRVRGTVAKLDERISAYLFVDEDDRRTGRVTTNIGLGSETLPRRRHIVPEEPQTIGV